VVGNNELPESNIGGYIYTMAKFMCLDHKRKQSKLRVVSSIEQENLNRKELAESPGMASELLEASQLEDYRRRAIDRAIKQLSDNCQRLFTAMLETGLEKPRELFAALGLKNARAVTVLRYECTKQLKVKAAVELEILTSGLSETR
jgi:DNA-directed RNA polymerase specialized sigma24 family protein